MIQLNGNTFRLFHPQGQKLSTAPRESRPFQLSFEWSQCLGFDPRTKMAESVPQDSTPL